MPTSPNDPDYKEVFAKFREQIESQRKKIPPCPLTPRGYSKKDPNYQKKLAQERQRQRDKKQKAKEERNAD